MIVFLIVLLGLAVGGRWACSYVCPVGILEELIYKIPFPLKKTALPGEKGLRKIKYGIFVLVLVLIPLGFFSDQGGPKEEMLVVKLLGFSTVFILSLMVYRPFCRYLCPFGVFLGLFNRISPFRYQLKDTCNQCTLCQRKCKMGIAPYQNPNSMECIRCGECLKRCPKKAIVRK